MFLIIRLSIIILLSSYYISNAQLPNAQLEKLKVGFLNPSDDARPGVYWYFMDGNLSREGMTVDLEAMKKAGIGSVIFLEINLGIPRGGIDFFSPEWRGLFTHAVHECERLGIEMVLGIGPGWSGSGGPWVKPNESMQHLVASSIAVDGEDHEKIQLPVPQPKVPFLNDDNDVISAELRKKRQDFYEDVMILAFPAVDTTEKIADIEEKALYYRPPYNDEKGLFYHPPYRSQPGVKAFFRTQYRYGEASDASVIKTRSIIDLTSKLKADGTLDWVPPKGKWTIVRFGRRNNGSITRPAPVSGLGFESDKFDTVALDHHLSNFTDKLLSDIGPRKSGTKGGLKTLHIDSWEMGAQNWTGQFTKEFTKRRGYDPSPFFPAYAGYIVESRETSERFLWDVRQTGQELVLDYHARHVKQYSHRKGLNLSIEPYDMNPTADLELGAVADLPMGEFWSNTFNSAYSCIEAASIGHVNGKSIIQAESFTGFDGYNQHPTSMKNRGDWAFACGINKFFFHTYVHQPFESNLKPGMTMGSIGIQWNRNQTWWPMVEAYHQYISRCQFMLRQGKAVADILYLTPEGAPHVFRAPPSALTGHETMPDRRGYNFDACAPGQLYLSSVKDNKVVFPGGASYHLLVLPLFETMTPTLLKKVKSLIMEGATVIGAPPKKSPSLTGYPACDKEVQSLAHEIWGTDVPPIKQTVHKYGKGKIIWGGEVFVKTDNLYPEYNITATILKFKGIEEDFEADSAIRYTHRQSPDWDIYFVSNRSDKLIKTDCIFRSTKHSPMIWDPVTGETRYLTEFSSTMGRLKIPLQFNAYQSFFIVLAKSRKDLAMARKNFPELNTVKVIDGAWNVAFDRTLGGPVNTVFDTLQSWTQRGENGIKYYSGIARYNKTFDVADVGPSSQCKFLLNLGEVKNMASVKLNGTDLGVVWTAPWTIDITSVIKKKNNRLEIEVANLWPNRIIGDTQLPDDGMKGGRWPDWLLTGKPRTSGRYTFTTYQLYNKSSPLLKSGLIGPVTIQKTKDN